MRWLTILVILTAACTAHADTTYVPGGDMSGIWNLDGSPYIISGQLNIPLEQQLAILPGVQCLFRPAAGMVVRGRLLVDGAPGDSVIFGPVVTNATWPGIVFNDNSGPSQLDYARITRVAYSSTSNAIRVRRASVIVTHSSVRENLARGVYVAQFGRLEMHDCEIVNNGDHG